VHGGCDDRQLVELFEEESSELVKVGPLFSDHAIPVRLGELVEELAGRVEDREGI